jgi:hypothetical protein
MCIQHKRSIKYECVIVNYLYGLFSFTYTRYDALQVGGFGDIQQHWVVLGLAANLDQPQRPVGVEGGGQHFEEIGWLTW